MYVSTMFLNDELEDDIIYVNPPPGYESLVPPDKSLKLMKDLYGLKQASNMWNLTWTPF